MDFYMILDIIMLAGPLILSFDKKVAFWRSWPIVIPATFMVIIVFGIWDVFKSLSGVWWFSEVYTGTIRWGGMPPGEWFFFFCVPYACIFILSCVRAYFKDHFWKPRRWPWLIVAGVFLIASILTWGRIYTTTVLFSVAFFIALAAIVVPKTLNSRSFWVGMGITYIPFLIFNSILTGLPVVLYDDTQNLAIRVGTIPIEDFFYSFSMLLLGMATYDFLARHIPKITTRIKNEH
jgi:lycopene cyclase domain-containing protein